MYLVLIWRPEAAAETDQALREPFDGIELGFVSLVAEDAEAWVVEQSEERPDWHFLITPSV
jgi:hypothetical protein